MSVLITKQMVDGLIGDWPSDDKPASRTLLMLAVWRHFEQQFGEDEMLHARLLAGRLRDDRLINFERRQLQHITPSKIKSLKSEARREMATG